MDNRRWTRRVAPAVLLLLLAVAGCTNEGSSRPNVTPLPSWNDGPVKAAILKFVAAVTDESGEDYVKPAERIAVFDNDGTLWVEYPMDTQVLFMFDRVKALAPQHPGWNTTQPFQALLEGDMKTVGASGEKGILQMAMATHSGMTAGEFRQEVLAWLAANKHSKFDRPYTECVYQPQLELLAYLRANGFKTFIVSGGGIQFMRPFSEEAYGIPPEQVVGSSVVAEFQIKDGEPALVRMPKIAFVNDKAGKPVGIYEHIGRRPILAFGNSDGDMQMVQYTTAGEGRRLGLFLHHTDDAREYAYDRQSHVGKLDKALDQADANGWVIVSMADDWNTVFPPRARDARRGGPLLQQPRIYDMPFLGEGFWLLGSVFLVGADGPASGMALHPGIYSASRLRRGLVWYSDASGSLGRQPCLGRSSNHATHRSTHHLVHRATHQTLRTSSGPRHRCSLLRQIPRHQPERLSFHQHCPGVFNYAPGDRLEDDAARQQFTIIRNCSRIAHG